MKYYNTIVMWNTILWWVNAIVTTNENVKISDPGVKDIFTG